MRNNWELRRRKDVNFSFFQPGNSPNDEFREFITNSLIEPLAIGGYKQSEKRDLLVQMCQLLTITGLTNRVISDSRDLSKDGVSLRCKLWDMLIEAGYAKCCIGSQRSQRETRYAATPKLLALHSSWDNLLRQSSQLHRNSTTPNKPRKDALVVGRSKRSRRTKERRLLPWPTEDYWLNLTLLSQENFVEQMNQLNELQQWTASGPDGSRFAVGVQVREIHSGGWDQYCRYYSWGVLSYQQLSKHQRATITVNDAPTTELDYSGSLPKLLYHRFGLDVPGDVYQTDQLFPTLWDQSETIADRKFLRDVAKRCTNICLNVSSRSAAARSVGRFLNRCNQQYGPIINDASMNPETILSQLLLIHQPVASHFFTNIGVRLMYLEFTIISCILKILNSRGIPALSMHDGIICRQSDQEEVRELMNTIYPIYARGFPVIPPSS